MSGKDQFEQLRTFRLVAELGSITAAARRLRVGQPAVSKRLRALEERLGARLVERSTTGLAVTEGGRAFLSQVSAALDNVERAEDDIRTAGRALQGRLSLHIPVGLGELHLTRLLLLFRAAHPAISLDVLYDDRFADLVSEGVDLALRIGALSSPELVVRKLAHIPRLLVASPAYLRTRGRPKRPSDLERHAFVRYSRLTQGDALTLERDATPFTLSMKSSFLVNNSVAVRELALASVGIAMVPRWLVHDELAAGLLEPVLPDWALASVPLHAVYPSATLKPKRVVALVDYLQDALVEVPGLEVVRGARRSASTQPPETPARPRAAGPSGA
jgi:DNA-binding transcriptional LysR family regulator